jgi:hypothetical protein
MVKVSDPPPKLIRRVPRKPVAHALDISCQHFALFKRGVRTAEICSNDRDFRAGDALCLREWDPLWGHTGRVAWYTVPSVVQGVPGLAAGHAVLCLRPMPLWRRLFQRVPHATQPCAHGYHDWDDCPVCSA